MQARRLPGVRAGASTAFPRLPLLSHRLFSGALSAPVASSEARTMVSASADRLGGSHRPDFCSLRGKGEAVESPKEMETLLNSPCGEQSSSKYLSKGFPERYPPPPPLFGRCFGDGDLVDYVQRVKGKRKGKNPSQFE